MAIFNSFLYVYQRVLQFSQIKQVSLKSHGCFFVPYEIPILGTSILKQTPNSQIVDDVLYMVPTVHMCKIVYVYIYNI